jgi:D-alanine transaminase
VIARPYSLPVLVHLNGDILPLDQARISPLDRGFIFGDGVYEGLRSVSCPDGARIVGQRLHTRRMQAGLDEAGIRFDASSLEPAALDLLKANGLRDAFIYWQVSRGTPGPGEPPRSRAPAHNSAMRPTVFGYCTPQPPLAAMTAPPTKRAITHPDIRWSLGHLKSISLMGNVMSALAADRRGADECILIRRVNGVDLITEGLATNVILALPSSLGAIGERSVELVTPSLDSAPMLAGVTRAIVLRACPEIIQRPVRADELPLAREIMFVGTTTFVTAVTHVDNRPVHDGAPGPECRRLFRLLLETIATHQDDCGE